MVAERVSIVVGGGQYHTNKLIIPIRLIVLMDHNMFLSYE
jgi:hypothetical protein